MDAKRTGAPARVVDGIEWTCWYTGIMQYEWRAVDFPDHNPVVVNNGVFKNTYSANVDGAAIGKRFGTITNAIRAANKLLKERQHG